MSLATHQRTVLSDYREFPAPVRLADYFLCFWKQVIIGSREYAHRVLPDACVDIGCRQLKSPAFIYAV
jgi:hypothetical protein